MSRCPKCGTEYIEGYTRCSDCEIDLVENVEQLEFNSQKISNKIINYIGYANWIIVILIVILMLNMPNEIMNKIGFIVYYLIFSFIPPLICIILAFINRDLKGLNFINVVFLLIYFLAFLCGRYLLLSA